MVEKQAEITRNRLSIKLNETQLDLFEADITEVAVDAIVNPANEDLKLGAGVGLMDERTDRVA